jgi:hypothetical protein
MTETEIENLTVLCRRLGAEPAQAATMAAQLLKRAEQLAAERGIERTAALGYLVELVIKGRNGETPPEFPAGALPRG